MSGGRTNVRIVTTDQKGAIAETAIGHAAVKLGIDVYRPIVEGGRFDLIFDLGKRLLRVQCKWAVRRKGVVNVRCYSSRRIANGHRVRRYTAEEIDAIAAYCAELDRCFLLPACLVEGHGVLSLRLEPTRNRQKLNIRWADDYDFARLDWKSISGP
ncbi:MAG: group I intron-associated PD-(D/E)XK endonuclease [Gaiellaceae bacterium]